MQRVAHRRTKGILPDHMIAALARAGGILPATRFRARPDPAGEPRPAARRGRLSRARELPARAATTVAERIDELKLHEIALDRRRGAGDRLRLHRAADRKPGAAGRHRGRRQSEKLDRPARRVHPRDRRRARGFDRIERRLSRSALRRDQPADISGAGARGLAAVADPLPPRPCRARCRRACARCTTRERLVDDADADVERRRRGRRRSRRASARTALRRLPRQAPHRRDRRRAARRLRRRRFLGADAWRARTRA